MKKSNVKGSIILCTAALLWGLAFVAQNRASSVPPFMINCLRSFISLPFLYIVFRIFNRKKQETLIRKEPKTRKHDLLCGLTCGVTLTVAANFQQFGIAVYPKSAPVEAHAGFITALYVIIVPIMAFLINKKISVVPLISALIALVGFYFLCLKDGFGKIYLGDILILVCAFAFALQIMAVDRCVGSVGGIRLSFLQFAVTAVLSGILSIIFERDLLSLFEIIKCILPILYLGIVSSGIAYTLQIIGQKYAEPAVASVSMSLESVFAALGGWVISGNQLTKIEILGCLLVFSAIIFVQVPEFLKK